MKRMVILMLIACSFACNQTKEAELPFFDTPDLTPLFLTASDAAAKKVHTVPSFSFTNQNGETITQKNVEGKIYVADFFFTKCTGICPKMTTNMSKVARAFSNSEDIMILSHSVTPDKDSVSVLKKYAQAKNITNSNWHLLTGNRQSIYDIAHKGYYADESLGVNKDTSEFLHTENFVLVDRHRRIRGIYNGTIELEVDNLIKHIGLLKVEE